MTDQQKRVLRLIHTLSQNCGACYDDYLYDRGNGGCVKLAEIEAIVPDDIAEPGIPTTFG